ncbi:MAG: hypothetical protein QOI83_4076, partial [Streptomycetaceae bacterium]|nr:hypothetical protein [Streptomycetaceae bacterium]
LLMGFEPGMVAQLRAGQPVFRTDHGQNRELATGPSCPDGDGVRTRLSARVTAAAPARVTPGA